MLCFKVEMHVSIPAEQTFHLLSDLQRRKEWDRHYESVTYVYTCIWNFASYGTSCCSVLFPIDIKSHKVHFIHYKIKIN